MLLRDFTAISPVFALLVVKMHCTSSASNSEAGLNTWCNDRKTTHHEVECIRSFEFTFSFSVLVSRISVLIERHKKLARLKRDSQVSNTAKKNSKRWVTTPKM